MAAIFDANGAYAGDDGMGDDTPAPKPAMDPEVARLLARYPAPPSSPTFVDRVKQTMIQAPFALRDVGKMATMFHPMTMAAPIVAGEVEAAGNAISQYGKEGLYRLIGDKENADRVAAEKQPTIPELWQKYYGRLQPQTEAGKAVMEPIGKVLQNLPMVPSGPRGSGFAVPQPSRPLLTPNDAIALRGEANRVASQVRDIPVDFANAQSGFRRIDPITNKPTVGTKLQGAAESVGDTMQRRKEQGLNPVPGVPDVFQPETQLFAVRPDKSMAIVPKVPPTVSQNTSVRPFDALRTKAEESLNAIGLGNTGEETARDYNERYLHMAPREVKQALKDFNEADLRQMFPNILDIEDAKNAAEILYSDSDAKEQRKRDLLNRFAKAHPQFNLPTFDEHQQRVDAVRKMIHDEYVPWVAKHAGTPSDPQLLLAQEGKTVMEPEKLLERASDYKPSVVTERKRVAAGFPAQGTTYTKRLELQAQLDQAKEVADASQNIYAAQASAAGPGQSAHRMFADFDANRAQKEKDAAVVKDLEKKLENTTLGQAYEDLVDQLVEPHIASAAQAQVMPHMQQFYPKLMKQGADQPVYSVAGGTYDTMALGTKIAEDVMSGKIPLDVVPKLKDFTPLARKYGEEQAQAYVARKEADKNFVVNANTRLKGIVDQVPQKRRFDKLGAIFIDSSMPIEQIDKITSDDTAILDHCIGEAGQVGKKSRDKLTGRQHGWVPMYNVASGKLEPKATRTHTRYGERIANGNYVVASLRDTETGYPITTIGWQSLGNGTWVTEYLSGFNNHEAISPEYRDSVKAFLNAANEGTGSEQLRNFRLDSASDLENRYALYDKNDKSSLSFARASINTVDKQALKDDPDILKSLPRFFSVEDFKQAVGSITSSANAREPDNVRGLMQARSILEEELASLNELGMSDQEMQTMVYDIQHEIADIDARLARLQTQPVAAPAEPAAAPQQAPVAPAPQLTRRQEIARDRAPQIARLFIEFSDPPLETPAQLRNFAARLYDPRDARDAAHDIAGVGDSLGNLILRASDYQRPNLVEVGRALNERADLLEQQQFIQQQQRQVPVANTGLTQETINSIQAEVTSAFEIDEGPVWRREVMPILRQYWDPTAPLPSIESMMAGVTAKLRNITLSQGDYWNNALGGPEAVQSFINGLQDLHQGLENIHDNTREIAAQGNLQSALNTPQARMAQITREQADVMPYAELTAAVGDPTRYDDIVVRALREIRMNESPASTVVDAIINGGQIGNNDLSALTPVERELIARDVTDAVSALSAARAAPRNTLRQDIVSAYVNALQHPTEFTNTALQSIRNVMDDITIEMQRRGENVNDIGNALLDDLRQRIRGVQGMVDRGESLQGMTTQGTSDVLQRLTDAREQVIQAMTRHAEQEVAQQRAQPQAQLPDIGDFIQTLRRQQGMPVANRVETVAFRIAENTSPTANPLEYAQALRRAATEEESELVERSLNELANAFEEGHIGAIVDAMLPDDQHGANQPQGPSMYVQSIQPTIRNLSNELFYMDVSPEGVPNLPAIANTIFALRNGTVDHAAFRAMPEGERQNAMNAVADDIEGRTGLAAPTAQQADLFRDVYSRDTNTMPVISDELAGHMIDDELSNIIRTYGQDVGERVGRVIEDRLEHMSFEDDPHGFINSLRRHTARGADVAVRGNVEQGLLDIAQRLEESFAAAFEEREQQRMEPNPVAHLFRDMPDAELARQLSPQDQGSVEASFEAMLADNNGFAADGVPTLPAAAMLTRRFNVYDLTEPAREALARRFEAEHRDRQQLAVQPAPEVADPQQGRRSISELYDLFNDAVANAIEEGSYDPDMDSNENMAQLVLDDMIGGELQDLTDGERQALANVVRQRGYRGDLGEDINEPPPRRGPFQPGGSSAVRGRPLGNLNIQPAIRAESLRGPDSQPVRNFLQQVRGLPGVTQEGLATGLMAFENMDPNRRMTKAEFVRELLPSSYDIVSLQGTADDNVHYRDMAEAHVTEDPETVLDQMGIPDRYHGEILDVVVYGGTPFEYLSSGAKKALRKQNITDYDSLYAAHAEAFRIAVEVGMEYLADMDGTQVTDENGFRYANNQRLVLKSSGDDYSEFGVTHPDQQGTYHHFANAPESLIGHVRGTYNPDGLEIKTADADIFTTKSNSYVIEEIQSDAQKNSQQVAHLHQVHGVLFKAAIQKALESGADVVYLPTAKVIASERPGAGGHEPVRDERTGIVTMVPIKKDTTSKFKPIYDQAIVKEGLKPLLKIPGVKSTLVSNGDYHEITFTQQAKDHILNGPGQTVPGYAKGGLVMPISKYMGNSTLAGLTYKYGGYMH